MANTRTLGLIGQIRGHDWHFHAVTVDNQDPMLAGWVVAKEGVTSTQQLAFMAIAAAAAAAGDRILITFENHTFSGGSGFFNGVSQVTLVQG